MTPEGIINIFKSFNRKERFAVVAQTTQGGFSIDQSFFNSVVDLLGVDNGKADFEGAFMAMDYHFDWIAGALGVIGAETFPAKNDGSVQGNQEDVDLLLVFKQADECHLAMIEAKCETGWINKQTESKAKRLRMLFPEGKTPAGIVPHWLLFSPKTPQKLRMDLFPDWAKPNGGFLWLKMNEFNATKSVERCDAKGVPFKKGVYWHVVEN